MRQLAYKGPPTPPNLGTLQGVGILKPVVIVSKVKDVGRYTLQALPAKIFRRHNPAASIHIERFETNGQPNIADFIRP